MIEAIAERGVQLVLALGMIGLAARTVRTAYRAWQALGDDPGRETAADAAGVRPRDMRMVDGKWVRKDKFRCG